MTISADMTTLAIETIAIEGGTFLDVLDVIEGSPMSISRAKRVFDRAVRERGAMVRSLEVSEVRSLLGLPSFTLSWEV